MIKYTKLKGTGYLLKINEEANTLDTLDTIHLGSEYFWVIDEDGMYEDKEVKKGDLLIKFRKTRYAPEYVLIIRDENINNRYLKYKEYYSNLEKEKICCGASNN